jgi:hypothetical protein
MGSAMLVAAIAAGFPSATWIARHYAVDTEMAASVSSAACVAEDGSWKNWVWANVPALSPKCAPER